MNPDAEYAAQLERQYTDHGRLPFKRPLDFAPFSDALEQFPAARRAEITSYLRDTSVQAYHRHLRTRTFTVTEAILWYLSRIRALEDSAVNALVELNPDVLSAAAALDATADDSDESTVTRPALWGVPVLVKDNIATGDRMHTTAGAAVMKEARATADASVVSLLRRAGALIVGKANMSEWAFFMASEGASGYSALGGQTRNAYGRFDVGGSSSGSAVGVALDLALVSLGSETCGSIVNPASQNGLVGFKPAVGAVPGDGVIPIAPAFDVVGPIARSVDDARIVYEALGGPAAPAAQPADTGARRIGIVTNRTYLDTFRGRDRTLLGRLRGELDELGFSVLDVELDDAVFALDPDAPMLCAFGDALAAYLEEHQGPVRSLREVIAFNAEDPAWRAPFGQELLERSEESTVSARACGQLTERHIAACREAIDRALDQSGCAVLLSVNEYLAPIYAPAGYPAVTVPAGFHGDGEPVGITLTAPAGREPALFAVAQRYERLTNRRRRSTRYD